MGLSGEIFLQLPHKYTTSRLLRVKVRVLNSPFSGDGIDVLCLVTRFESACGD